MVGGCRPRTLAARNHRFGPRQKIAFDAQLNHCIVGQRTDSLGDRLRKGFASSPDASMATENIGRAGKFVENRLAETLRPTAGHLRSRGS